MSEPKSKNITWHNANISHEDREKHLNQKGCVVWFTGLSGAGKSTVARKVEELLIARGNTAYVLDGDNLRMGLNKDLGFAPADRTENIRRVGCVAQLFADAGVITLTAFISPYRVDRDNVRALLAPGEFVEILCDASLETCEERDPKGLYKKARAGEIKGFTGIDDPYEAPEKPEMVLDSNHRDIPTLAAEVVAWLEQAGVVAKA